MIFILHTIRRAVRMEILDFQSGGNPSQKYFQLYAFPNFCNLVPTFFQYVSLIPFIELKYSKCCQTSSEILSFVSRLFSLKIFKEVATLCDVAF